MGYMHIINRLHDALEDTYKITSQRWYDKHWNGVDSIIRVLNVELAYILDSHYVAYIKYVDGFIINNTIKVYKIAIKDWNGNDVIHGQICCHGMGTIDIWSSYELSCQLYTFEE